MTASLGNCDRCFDTRRSAKHRVRFVYQSRPYITNLCPQHERMLDSDMMNWIRTASEVGMELPPNQPGTVDRTRVQIPQPPPPPPSQPPLRVTRQVPPSHTSTAESWLFTQHAQQRMSERNVTPEDVWRVIDSQEKIRRCPSKPGGSPDTALYVFGNVKVTVNESTREIMTVASEATNVPTATFEEAS